MTFFACQWWFEFKYRERRLFILYSPTPIVLCVYQRSCTNKQNMKDVITPPFRKKSVPLCVPPIWCVTCVDLPTKSGTRRVDWTNFEWFPPITGLCREYRVFLNWLCPCHTELAVGTCNSILFRATFFDAHAAQSVNEWQLWIWVLRRTPRVGSGTVHCYVAQAELLKLRKSGQFPDEPVGIKFWQIHHVTGLTY